MEKSSIYAAWHKHPMRDIAHFLVLALVAALFVSGVEVSPRQSVLVYAQGTSAPLTPVAISAGKASEKLPQLTAALLQAIKQYQITSDVYRTTAISNLTSAALSRRQAMLEEADRNPASFLLSVLPPNITQYVPSEIISLVEQEANIQGVLTIYHIDLFDENQSRFEYILEDSTSGKKYNLHFAKGESNLLTGSVIKVKGTALDQELVTAEAGGTSVQTMTVAASGPTGDQRTLVIVFNFLDNISQPWTTSQVYSTVFSAANSSNLYYQDNSFGQTSFSGDVAGWFTIPYNASAGCNYSTWASAADSAAISAGINLANYSRKSYVFPRVSVCSWAGLGTLGGNPSRMWSNGYGTDPRLFDHEFGHNLSVHHASSLSCGSKQIDSYANCTFSEYGNPSDTMGSWNSYQWNVPHKAAVGWVPAVNIQVVTADGTYGIAPLEVSAIVPQALKIYKPDTKEYYYFGYRQPKGFDSGLGSGMINGAQIDVWNGNAGTQTKLIDSTPGNGFSDAALTDGRTFQDTTNGITVTQLSHDSTGAILQVTFGPIVCVKSKPTVSISPLSKNGSAGQTLTYSVSVTNNDTSSCQSTSFSFNISGLPAGFTFSASPITLSLAPASNGSVQFSVTSPVNQPDGSYTFTVTAADTADSTHSNSASATYVAFTDIVAPTVSITSPLNGSTVGNSTNISVSATDDVGVTKVEFSIDDSLVSTNISSPYSYRWNSRKAAAGTHTIMVKAYDAAAHTASASITVYK